MQSYACLSSPKPAKGGCGHFALAGMARRQQSSTAIGRRMSARRRVRVQNRRWKQFTPRISRAFTLISVACRGRSTVAARLFLHAVVLLVPMELTLFQILAAAVCLAVALVGLGLPALLRHSASALSIGNCLAAGCILGGGLLHLLPDAAESLADVGGEYPTGHLVFPLGLLLPIVIEQLAASYVASHKQRRPLLRTRGAPQRAAYAPPAAAEAPCEHDHGHAEAHGQAHAHGGLDARALGGRRALDISRPQRGQITP